MPRTIIHLDMDAFYAAVEVLDNPELQGKPVIVGGAKERGVVSSASYEARKFGVHSAQPIATALSLCPHGVFLPVRMARYKEVSDRVFSIFHRFTPLVEPLSIDEAFLDVTGSLRIFGTPEKIVQEIKKAIKEEIGLTVSAGIAPLKFIAKIASDLNKPDGLTVVLPEQVKAFLEPLPIDRLWGVGKKTQQALALLNVRTIGDLNRIPVEVLKAKFGKHGLHLHRLSIGVDDREVETEREVKSIGREETYSEDLSEIDVIRREILSLATRVARRLRREGFAGRTVTLKVKYHDFVQITRSVSLPEATDDGREIFRHCLHLLKKTAAGEKPIRLLGVSVSQFDGSEAKRQRSLFDDDATHEKDKSLNRALDAIQEKFGDGSIIPGTLLEK
jgi:DNA polymerase-4